MLTTPAWMEEATMRRPISFGLTLALALLVAPLASAAQSPGEVYRIGYLATAPPAAPV